MQGTVIDPRGFVRSQIPTTSSEHFILAQNPLLTASTGFRGMG